VRPASAWLCDVTSPGSATAGAEDPYDVVSPYSTCVVAPSFVVQVMVAAVCVIPDACTAEMDGAVVSAAVENVKSPVVARLPAASRLSTR
jgi:hypothetical protein